MVSMKLKMSTYVEHDLSNESQLLMLGLLGLGLLLRLLRLGLLRLVFMKMTMVVVIHKAALSP